LPSYAAGCSDMHLTTPTPGCAWDVLVDRRRAPEWGAVALERAEVASSSSLILVIGLANYRACVTHAKPRGLRHFLRSDARPPACA
jgi:hypothetical protein